MGTADDADLLELRDAVGAAEFDLTLALERIAQKVAAGDSFTTAQQKAAAQLLEIAPAVRELVADSRVAVETDSMRRALVRRARQLLARTAELRDSFGEQPVSQADLADRPGRPPVS